MNTTRLAFVAFMLAGLLSAASATPGCHSCMFKFCDDTFKFSFGNAQQCFSKEICTRDGKKVGLVYTGESRIYKCGKLTKITKYGDNGDCDCDNGKNGNGNGNGNGDNGFCPATFRAFTYKKDFPLRSCIGHDPLTSDQKKALQCAKCIILPITAAEFVSESEVVSAEYYGPWTKGSKKCIAFSFRG